MSSGSCLCGNIHYTIGGALGDIVHCHCVTCRKAHGSAFSSVAAVKDEEFSLSGREHLNTFESSPGKTRYFCANRGSQIYAKRQGTGHVILRLGTLDEVGETREACHIWVSQQADWYEINSELPEFPEFAE